MTTPTAASVIDKAAGSVKWSALMEVVSRTAQPIVFVIMARLLTPEDYGVVATASIAITFSQMFWDAGLSKALIQARESGGKTADVVFWTNIMLGVVFYSGLFTSAGWIAEFFKSPAAGPVLRVLALQVLIAAFTSVQNAILVRDFNFRSLFWIRLATAFSPGLISIPLAYFGFGVWALVSGSLVGQVINLGLHWWNSPWRPRWRYDWVVARELFGFGVWVVLESIGAWCITWGDNLIVGRYLGVHELGVYRTGSLLVTTVFGLALNPILPILFPTLSRLQDDRASLTSTFSKVNRLIISLALPMGVGLLLVGPELSGTLFGEKWKGLGFVVGVMGLMHGTAWLVALNAELYRAMGRPDVNTKLMYAQLFYYLPAFFISAQHGLPVFVWTRFIVALVATPIHIYLCVRMLDASPFYLWQQGSRAFLGTAVMVVAVLGSKQLLYWTPWQTWVSLVVLVANGAVVYACMVWLLDRALVMQTVKLLTRVASV